jgi:hypothetical protein
MNQARDALAKLSKGVEWMIAAGKVNWPLDHACAECVPGGEIVVPGFQCGRHAALSALSAAPEGEPVIALRGVWPDGRTGTEPLAGLDLALKCGFRVTGILRAPDSALSAAPEVERPVDCYCRDGHVCIPCEDAPSLPVPAPKVDCDCYMKGIACIHWTMAVMAAKRPPPVSGTTAERCPVALLDGVSCNNTLPCIQHQPAPTPEPALCPECGNWNLPCCAELAALREALAILDPYTPRCADESPVEWARRLLSGLRQMHKNFHSLLDENATLREYTKSFHEALVELERAGWPCRLVELPAEYTKLGHELAALREQLENEKRWRSADLNALGAAHGINADLRAKLEEAERARDGLRVSFDRTIDREDKQRKRADDAEKRIEEAVAYIKHVSSLPYPHRPTAPKLLSILTRRDGENQEVKP